MPGKIDNALIGAAGVHFVVSELSLRGLIALPTIRNAPGIDVVVVDPCGSWHANLQVKTSQSKVRFWPVGAKYSNFSGPYNFYVFVRYLNRESRFEAFLVPADEANAHIREIFEEGRTQGYKDWAPMHIKLTASREAPVALYGYHTLHNALERSLPYGDNTTGSPCHA